MDDSTLADLASDDTARQIRATRRCARERDPTTLPPLRALTRSVSADVRAAAYWAIDQLRAPEAIPALLAGLDDPDFFVRSNAGWALVHLGPAVTASVQRVALHSDSDDAREMALLVLERIPASAPLRATALRDAPEVDECTAQRLRVSAAVNDISSRLMALDLVLPDLASRLAPETPADCCEVMSDMLGMLDQVRCKVRAVLDAEGARESLHGDRATLRTNAATTELAMALHDAMPWITGLAICGDFLRECEDLQPREVRADIALVRRAIARITELVAGVQRILARGANPRFAERPTRVALSEFADRTAWLLRRMASPRGVHTRVVLAASAAPAVDIDLSLLEAAVDGLLTRALRGVDQGEVSLEIDASGGGVTLRARDTSRGPGGLAKPFDAGLADGSLSTLAQRLFERGGRLEVASSLGAGASIEAWIPAFVSAVRGDARRDAADARAAFQAETRR
ncbi:MAG: HEAT repeat domain-containing protein [Polyangiales bacterium]